MTTLREAATAALEALEFNQARWQGKDEAIEALRAALAEPVQEPDHETRAELAEQQLVQFAEERDHYRNLWLKAKQAEPVPVAWLWQHRETGRTRVLMPDERTATDVAAAWDVVGPLYLALPQRKPEPVALDWLHKWANQDDGEPETQWHEGYEAARRVVQIHLTAPPQRKPLTEEEIQHCFKEAGITIVGEAWTKAIRAIERAHGIK